MGETRRARSRPAFLVSRPMPRAGAVPLALRAPPALPPCRQVEAEAIAALDQGTEVRTDCRLAGAKERWISAVVSPVLDHDHQVAGYLAATTDVSERKERAAERERLLAGEQRAWRSAETARRELASHIDRLRELDELKSQFLAMVSHELRTPLASVISFAGLIAAREGSLSDESADHLRIIERNAAHLLHLVGDLMMLGGLETGVVGLKLDSVSVPGLIGDAVETGSAEAARRGVSLVGAAQSGPPARGDRLRLTQVMDNLVSNAVKFTGDGGRVTVSATCDKRQWRIDGEGQPTVLYTHSIHDVHQDHRNTHRAAMVAGRRIGRVYYCFQSPSATVDFGPSLFVGIDAQLDGKLAAIGAFISQTSVRDYLEPDLIKSTARYWGRFAQARYAEAFEVIRDRVAVRPGHGLRCLRPTRARLGRWH